ncbi:MAG: glycosyltransferase [Flavobacteriia bacterium]|nr:glycosyltransferase [Flavobacteriia bacterium]
MNVAQYIFWISFLLILWSYIGYPILLYFLDDENGTSTKWKGELPEIDVIFAAYNEEAVIAEKIKSVFNSEYPSEKINLHIGSDASTDETDAIITALKEEHPNLHLHRMPGRTGKSGIINYLVSKSEAPIILASDANIFFKPDMMANMINQLSNQEVALVGGTIVYRDMRKEGIAGEEELYLSFENQIKRRESNIWGFALGVEGGCYMIRREYFEEIPPLTFMEDFFITMSTIRQGGKVIFDTNAVCTEDVSVDKSEEFKRKVRISLGNFQNLNRFKGMISSDFWPVGFAFLSHKVIRWITPILLINTLISSAILALFTPQWIYEMALYIQTVLLILVGIDTLLPSISSRSSLIRFVGHFYLMNFALLKGLLIYIQGVESNVWQPTKRAQKRS